MAVLAVVAKTAALASLVVLAILAILAVLVALFIGSRCSTKPFVESSDELRVTLTSHEPAIEGDLVVRINDRVRGESWDRRVDPDSSALEDWFSLWVNLSPNVGGVRVSLVPVDGPGALLTPKSHWAADGYEEVPVDGWYREKRTSFIGGGNFDFACPLHEPCEVAFRYRIEQTVPMEAGERIEIVADAQLRANEYGPGGIEPRHDGAEMAVELHPPTAVPPIVEAFEIGTVPVTGRNHRGKFEVPVTIRYPKRSEVEVVSFFTLGDRQVRFIQDDSVISAPDNTPAHLGELPLMVGACDDDGCVIKGQLFTEVGPDAGSVTFWAHVRSGWNLHNPPGDLAVEVDLAPEPLPPPAWMTSDTDD